MKKIVECVPNISEGRDIEKINEIAGIAESVEGVKLLDVDPGKATNRTVITFVGEPEQVIEAAFRLIKRASELIDMSRHKGEHPRMGATDVCPLIPVSGISMDETVRFAHKLAERVGRELQIPVYCYENAALKKERRNLAYCRSGEYEGLAKISKPGWAPDFGPREFNSAVKKTGATAIGARDFLVAYNVNLNTTSTRRANAIAFDIREAGRVKTDSKTGKQILDKKGEPIRIPGKLKAVKGIGWYIEEYGIAQISLNLTNISVTPVHLAFDEACKSAQRRGMRVTGSEIVGLVPLKSLIEAADFFLKKQERSLGISEREKIKIAVKSLGLDDLKPFVPEEKIIEYKLGLNKPGRLAAMDLVRFADETASESPAPGGGSISAYVGALGVSLGVMVANLSSHKRGWDDKWEEFSDAAEEGMKYRDKLLRLVDEDTIAFNRIMEAFAMPKGNKDEVEARKKAIENATKYAIEIPFSVMKISLESMNFIKSMTQKGNPNSITDAAVGGLCAATAARGAYLNVQINASGLSDRKYAEKMISDAKKILSQSEKLSREILALAESKI